MAQQVSFGGGNPFATAARWIKVWVGLVVMAVVVVSLFLVAIINALQAIDRSLATTTPAVGTIRESTDPLTGNITEINKSLTNVDMQLKDVPDQFNVIISQLTSIDGAVANVNTSLANTSSVLITGLAGLKTVDDILEESDDTGSDSKGVKTIIAQANTINPILVAANADTTRIDGSLSRTDGAARHVQSICRSTVGTGCD